MGRSLVRALLSHGDQCTAVGWTQENTMEQMQNWQEKKCLGLLCDVRVRETVDSVIKRSIEHWGNIDIIAKYVLFHLGVHCVIDVYGCMDGLMFEL
jgi:NADP-dependent 3-hydroxy acid dehydrogenase YdfG